MLRMRLCSLDNTGRQAALYGTMEGSIGYIASVWDGSVYMRLQKLQKLLTLHLSHPSGLNPQSFRRRCFQPTRSLTHGIFRQGKSTLKELGILDLQLIWRYLHLNRLEQESLAQRGGAHRHQLINDLQQIAFMTSFF